MAEAFINQLLRIENSIQPHSSGEPCIICLTECGTLSPDDGIVEWEIRLPCKHTVGSRCIATWLNPTGAANNSCPLCRYVFFPAQPRPYLEHGVFEDGQIDEADSDGNGTAGRSNYNLNYAPWVPVNRSVGRREDEGIESDQDAALTAEDFDVREIEHAHMLRRSARPRETTRDDDEEMHEESIGEDGDEDGMSEYDRLYATELETTKTMCETYCYRLSLDAHPRAIAISQRIADKTYTWCRLAGHTPSSTAAVAIYVASHLIGVPKTARTVHMMTGVDADEVSGTDYPEWIREALLDEEMLVMIGRGGRGVVLRLMPRPWFRR